MASKKGILVTGRTIRIGGTEYTFDDTGKLVGYHGSDVTAISVSASISLVL